MVLFEMRVLNLLFEQSDVIRGGSHEVDTFQVHQLFLDVLNLLDEVDVVFV